MLEEQRRLDFLGEKEDIIFFLNDIIGHRALLMKDIRALCSHAPEKYQLPVDSIIKYCLLFGWIEYDEFYRISSDLACFVGDSAKLNDILINKTISFLFQHNVFDPTMFSYNIEKSKVQFHNEKLHLCYATVRNVLISQGFITVERNGSSVTMFIDPIYEVLVSEICKENKKKITLAQLKDELEKEADAGEKAEEFVLEFEKKRLLSDFLISRVRKISDVDVSAGYDLISFETDSSTEHDRFIEVKAFSNRKGFYWSNNELEVAKLKGEHYYLYLVDLTKITNGDYAPIIISNPAKVVMESANWLVEPETYHVRRI